MVSLACRATLHDVILIAHTEHKILMLLLLLLGLRLWRVASVCGVLPLWLHVACYLCGCGVLPLRLWRVDISVAVACRYSCGCGVLSLSVAVACRYSCGVSLCLWLWRVALSVACLYVCACGVSICLWCVAMSVACRYVCGVSLCLWLWRVAMSVACRYVCGCTDGCYGLTPVDPCSTRTAAEPPLNQSIKSNQSLLFINNTESKQCL